MRLKVCNETTIPNNLTNLWKFIKNSHFTDYFLITDVDNGLFYRAGFIKKRIWELNGNINYF